ncbi:MAG: FAD-binding protein [Thermoanaerobaculia bacterium]
MLNRRDFLKAAGVAALAPVSCVTGPTAPPVAAEVVNDIHSQLNATRVMLRTPRSIEEVRRILRGTRPNAVAIAGGRHAMGGQQFAEGATLLDMRGMNHVLGFDRTNGIIEVESGIEWPELIAYLTNEHSQWGIAQKQTGADRLTIGGGIAANVHGRGLRMRPLIADIESLVLIGPGGNPIECSRTTNRDLFTLVIGGYGLFGVVASARLRLTPRRKVQRVVEVQQIETVMAAFQKRIDDGFLYGDFQFSIDDKSDNFLRTGVFSCYRPVSDDTPIAPAQAELHPEDWLGLLYLAHVDKDQAYQRYVGYYLGTSGQIYWSDEHQLGFYPDDYHRALDAKMQAPAPATEVITEIYVPRERLADFMMEAREDFRRNSVNVIYGTVRLIERDDESFLAWAKQRYACVIFNLHTVHTPAGLEQSANAFRRLIDMAIARNGSYYLTYHRHARRDQVEACYPQFAEFLRRKRQHDPLERFQSDWYRHYKAMFAA